MPDLSFPQLGMEALIVLIAAVLVSIPLSLATTFYPFRLLFTSVHELGHAYATVLTGGKSKGFKVYVPAKKEEGGETYGEAEREGGNPYLIVPAGHLGVALFAAALLLLSGWPYTARYTLIALGVLLVLVIFKFGKGCAALAIGLLWGLLFIGVGWMADLVWVVFLLYLTAAMAIIRTFTSLKGLANSAMANPAGDHDAGQMAKLTGCSAMFWVNAWVILSALVLGATFWFVWLRTMER